MVKLNFLGMTVELYDGIMELSEELGFIVCDDGIPVTIVEGI